LITRKLGTASRLYRHKTFTQEAATVFI
jgi:hypothetical protein